MPGPKDVLGGPGLLRAPGAGGQACTLRKTKAASLIQQLEKKAPGGYNGA